MKSALIYDRLNKRGGAEEILFNLHEMWPDSTWYTSVYNESKLPESKTWRIVTSALNSIPYLRSNHELVPFLMPFAFESFDLRDFDIVISVSSAEAKGVITQPHTLHINYCLTPTRYLHSHRNEYLNSRQFSMAKRILRPLASLLQRKLSKWDVVAASRPDLMISISEHVKRRVKKYYNIDSFVIYPPVDTNKFAAHSTPPEISDYYLTVARLVPYKNLDILIQAFNNTGKKLVVIGEGIDSMHLKKLAKNNVIFKGWVNDENLVAYYQHALAFIQANEEDFGISMVEALASGTPVIAYDNGGAKEIVTNTTGLLFDDLSISGIMQTVDRFETMNFSKSVCQQRAKIFDKHIFRKTFRKAVEKEWQNLQKTQKY